EGELEYNNDWHRDQAVCQLVEIRRSQGDLKAAIELCKRELSDNNNQGRSMLVTTLVELLKIYEESQESISFWKLELREHPQKTIYLQGLMLTLNSNGLFD